MGKKRKYNYIDAISSTIKTAKESGDIIYIISNIDYSTNHNNSSL